MPVGKDHAWPARTPGVAKDWSVVCAGVVIADGYPTRQSARDAAVVLNGRRLVVTRAWKTAGRQWLLTDSAGRLVGTYETREAARRARAALC